MKPEIKQKWIAALRSGEFTQGRGRLHLKQGNNDFYCCLGVLCVLYADDNPDAIRYRTGGCLPQEVRDWAGMSTSHGNYSGTKNLADDNDSGKTFEQIANIIKENF